MARQVLWSSSHKGRDVGKTTASCEHFVLADLMRRGYDVTKPLSPTAKHDLHVKIGDRWYGVQVKSARYNPNTGNVTKARRIDCESPILALVYLPLWKIEYRAGAEALPEELCPSASSVVPPAKGQSSKGVTSGSIVPSSVVSAASSSKTSPSAVI